MVTRHVTTVKAFGVAFRLRSLFAEGNVHGLAVTSASTPSAGSIGFPAQIPAGERVDPGAGRTLQTLIGGTAVDRKVAILCGADRAAQAIDARRDSCALVE
jgi:hypothetical protein